MFQDCSIVMWRENISCTTWMTNQRVLNISYFIFCKILHSLSLSSLPYLNSLISEFFQHYETSMEADDVFLHGRNIVMCSQAPSKTTFYKFPLYSKHFHGTWTMNNHTSKHRIIIQLPTLGWKHFFYSDLPWVKIQESWIMKSSHL